MVIKGRKITVKLADENRVQKPRAFKANRFQSEQNLQNDAGNKNFSNKRPRKLATGSWKEGK
ncbi:hypothetical protein D3C86_2252590 [compost metagenome]